MTSQKSHNNKRSNLLTSFEIKELTTVTKANTAAENQRISKRRANNYQEFSTNKKRWSFNSSSIITTMLKSELGVRPLSPSTTTTLQQKEETNHPRKEINFYSDIKSRNKLTECDLNAGFSNDLQRFEQRRIKNDHKFHGPQHSTRISHQQTKIQYFNILPDEMILRVLKWLPKASLLSVSQVNKRFSRLIEDESLWEKIDCLGKVLSDHQLYILFSRKPTLLRLARVTIHDTGLSQMMTTVPLTHLDLSMAIITEQSLIKIMSSSPKLKKLSLEHVSVNSNVLRSFRSNDLNTLNLTMAYDLCAKTLAKVLHRQIGLQELNMGCVKVDWSQSELKLVLGSLPRNLHSLNVAGFRTQMRDEHTETISHQSPNLVDLDLSDCQELTGKTIETLSRMKNLQHLSLSRCYAIEPQSYTQLTEMKSLRYLELYSLFKETAIKSLTSTLNGIEINKFPFSAVARPTVGNKRSSIWGVRVRDF